MIHLYDTVVRQKRASTFGQNPKKMKKFISFIHLHLSTFGPLQKQDFSSNARKFAPIYGGMCGLSSVNRLRLRDSFRLRKPYDGRGKRNVECPISNVECRGEEKWIPGLKIPRSSPSGSSLREERIMARVEIRIPDWVDPSSSRYKKSGLRRGKQERRDDYES